MFSWWCCHYFVYCGRIEFLHSPSRIIYFPAQQLKWWWSAEVASAEEAIRPCTVGPKLSTAEDLRLTSGKWKPSFDNTLFFPTPGRPFGRSLCTRFKISLCLLWYFNRRLDWSTLNLYLPNDGHELACRDTIYPYPPSCKPTFRVEWLTLRLYDHWRWGRGIGWILRAGNRAKRSPSLGIIDSDREVCELHCRDSCKNCRIDMQCWSGLEWP